MEQPVLAINTGSSSKEYAICLNNTKIIEAYYETAENGHKLSFTYKDSHNSVEIGEDTFKDSLGHFLQLLRKVKPNLKIGAIGIRVVAPGRFFMMHRLIDDEYEQKLLEEEPLAPLHIETVLDELRHIRKLLSNVQVYSISDSAYHKSLSYEARNYAISRDDADRTDIYRYGYHGLSVSSSVNVLKNILHKNYPKVILCHLGSGASITALKNYKSVDTSMGYSTLEGLIMSTRSGDIGVEAALILAKKLEMNNDQLLRYLHFNSGLLGLSNSSSDIRVLLENESRGDSNSAFALSAMIYKIQKYIGAYSAVLNGLDCLIFTATVGERSAIIRERVCDNLDYLGLELDKNLNKKTNSTLDKISSYSSKTDIYVIPANETLEIARQTRYLL